MKLSARQISELTAIRKNKNQKPMAAKERKTAEPRLKSRAKDMKKVRQRRKDAGLVEFRAWVTPEQRDAIAKALQDIQAAEAYKPVIDYIQKL